MRRLFPAVALVSMITIGAVPPAGADPPFYRQQNLISDDTTLIPAERQDGLLRNAWGLVSSGTSPWWIANNGSDSSILFNASTGAIQSLVVAIPGGAPTGLVFNNSGGGFVVTSGTASASAVFIFSSEAGVISGWNPGVPPPPPSTQAQVGATVEGAIYKGLAIAGTGDDARLYATNFHAGTVDVFDNKYTLLPLPGAFVDPNLPAGYAPFGIQNINGTLYVTYALQDDDAEDDVAGPGHGFVDAYDTAGNLLRRVASRGPLNSPWGLALAPAGFGAFSNMQAVGQRVVDRIDRRIGKQRFVRRMHARNADLVREHLCASGVTCGDRGDAHALRRTHAGGEKSRDVRGTQDADPQRRRRRRGHWSGLSRSWRASISHDDHHELRHFHTGLKAHTCRCQVVERRAGPNASVSRDQHGAPARSAENEARLDDLRRDQHGPRRAQVLLDPRLVRVTEEIVERDPRILHQRIGLGRRYRSFRVRRTARECAGQNERKRRSTRKTRCRRCSFHCCSFEGTLIEPGGCPHHALLSSGANEARTR